MKNVGGTDNWHTEPTQVLSRITNNHIFVNNSERYCILPSWDGAAIKAASMSWQDHLSHLANSMAAVPLSVRRRPEATKLGYSVTAADNIAKVLETQSGVDALPMLEKFVD